MMIDLVATVLAEAETVTHYSISSAGGSYVNGRWVAASNTPVPIQATIQPVSGRQLMDMPEGIRVEARNVIWTPTTIAEGDEIEHAGKRYRIIYLWDRDTEGGFHRAAMGLKKS